MRIHASQVVLSRAVEIAPSERADEITGVLTVSQRIEGRELAPVLLAAASGARLAIGNDSVDFGAPWDHASEHASLQVPLPDGARADLLLAGRGRADATVLWAMVGMFALLSVSLAVRAFTKKRPRTFRWDDVPATPTSQASTPPASSPSPSSPSSSPSSARDLIGMAATAAPVLAPITSEQRIGRYAILRLLGQGGMAEVFLARSEGEAGFGKLVAFKVLQPLFAAQPVAVDLFLDEARLVSGLDHPNIVQTHDLGRAGDRYFIAMEYVEGPDGQLLHLVHRD